MAEDEDTKLDQQSDEEGPGPEAGLADEAAESPQALDPVEDPAPSETPDVAVAEAETKPKPRRKPAAKKAEGTAAAATGVDKAAAESALSEGSSEPVATRSASRQPEPQAKPRRRRTKDAGERVTVRAHAKYVRTSPRKARLIADHVRGKDVAEARAILAFSPRSVAEDWRKLLESAIANAEHNHDLVGENLRVLNATADDGPTLKRFRPRAMGRATRIRKRTSHLTITLTPKEN